MPRRRKSGGATVTYWYWRDPRDGIEKSLKCPNDRATAIRRAKELNAIVARELADRVIEDISRSKAKRLAGTPFDTFAAHCLTIWSKRGMAPNTLRSRKSLINTAIRRLGSDPLHEIGVPDARELLEELTEAGKNRTAVALRSVLSEVWREAYQDGILPADHPNPFAIVRRPTASVQRARLTLDAYKVIFKSAETLGQTRGAWLPNSVLLALVTGQRREDLAIAQFRRGLDWNRLWLDYQEARRHRKRVDTELHPYPYVEDGHLWVIQQKTGALVKIPLDLRLEVIGLSVGDVIDRCRSAVASRYLLHHTVPVGNAPRGAPVHRDTISRGFGDARDATDLQWPGKTPPTYHELRSLSERLYKEQGVNTQALLGHRHARMTEVYHDPRQAEWGTVSA